MGADSARTTASELWSIATKVKEKSEKKERDRADFLYSEIISPNLTDAAEAGRFSFMYIFDDKESDKVKELLVKILKYPTNGFDVSNEDGGTFIRNIIIISWK
jgi:hypothetical protein